ncbi:MAG: NosD domain-containing protein, partial [Acidimicrobiia bacterium]
LWIFGASGVRIANNVIRDAAGECLRIKYQAAGNEIVGNRIEDCGGDFDADDDEKNGEGIYIGTSPEQLDRNPTGEADASDRNWVHGNVIDTPAECVDIKEGASENVVEHNRCSGGEDPDGAGLSSRGNGNIFRHNISRGHDGAGIRLGGDTMSDGVDNVVVANRFEDNDGFGVKVQRSPQRQLCGNELSGNDDHHNGPVDPAAPC